MPSLTDVMTGSAITIPDHLEADAEVPVIAGLQFQGDLAVVPLAGRGVAVPNIVPVPPQGVEVVRGESGGHTHLLIGEGVSWAPIEARGDSLDLGALVVADGSVAYLLHEEHGASGIAPGRYVIRRQREQAEQVRRVAD